MRLNALVVVDDPRSRELIVEALNAHQIDTRSATNSQEALELFAQEKYDGIFLDLIMPELSGYEIARQVRQSSKNPHTPIIIILGKEENAATSAFDAGATVFLQKPLNKEKLRHLLNSTRGVMLAERRRSARIPIHTEVMWYEGDKIAKGRAYNLSLNGMFFQGSSSLRTGSAVQLFFSLTEQSPRIAAKGIVIHADKQNRVGTQFVDIIPKHRNQIREFVNDHINIR